MKERRSLKWKVNSDSHWEGKVWDEKLRQEGEGNTDDATTTWDGKPRQEGEGDISDDMRWEVDMRGGE